MCDAFSVRGKKLEPERAPCCVCTCGERSNHFVEDDEPCASLFRIEVSRFGLTKKGLLLLCVHLR